MHKFIALSLALFSLPAEAKNPIPDGGFMLVDPILSAGVKMGMIVPTFIHMNSQDDTLSFSFITTFTPDKQMCEMTNKCKRSVEALTLTVSGKDDRIVVEDSAINTQERIDRTETDAIFVIAPTQIFVDGATVSVAGDETAMPGTVTLTKPGGRSVRFVPSTLDFAESAIDFAKQFELALSDFDHCVVRQVIEFNALRDRTAAQENIVRVARFAGRLETLSAVWDYGAPPPKKGSVEWENERVRAVLRLSLQMGEEGGSANPQDRMRSIVEGTPLPKAFGDDFEMIYDEAVAGHEEDILAARAYQRSVRAMMDRLDIDAVRDRLCESVILH